MDRLLDDLFRCKTNDRARDGFSLSDKAVVIPLAGVSLLFGEWCVFIMVRWEWFLESGRGGGGGGEP